MNNKRLGTAFEREVVELLSNKGFWVHFITPNSSGSQPFDIIASKANTPIVADCKTSATRWFNISRLEENQIMAFELWKRTNNDFAYVIVKHGVLIYYIPYDILKEQGKVNLDFCEEYLDLDIEV